MRRRYRRYGRGTRSTYKYSPIIYFTHRYRNSGSFCSTAGFYDSVESQKQVCTAVKDATNKVAKSVCSNVRYKSYFNETEEFQCLPDFKAPVTIDSTGPPYFPSSEELNTLIRRYSKYKLVSVKLFLKNFKFMQIVIRCKTANVSNDERLRCQQYIIQKYGGGGTLDLKNHYIDYDKFDITYQYVPYSFVEVVYRNHTVFSDNSLTTTDVAYGAGDAPVKVRKLTAKSVIKNTYYPKGDRYLDVNKFYKDSFNQGDFKHWLDDMGATNYPNLTYIRMQLNADQYVDTDVNTMHVNVMFYDYYYYYRFKFAGINNLDVQ